MHIERLIQASGSVGSSNASSTSAPMTFSGEKWGGGRWGTGWLAGLWESLRDLWGGRTGHPPGGLFVCFPGQAEPSPPDPVGSTGLAPPRRSWGRQSGHGS